MSRARALLNGSGTSPGTPVAKRAARAQRTINGRLCLDISRVTSPEVREYLLEKYQGDAEAAYGDALKRHDAKCQKCGESCGHQDLDYLPTRMRAVEAFFKVAGVMAPDMTVNFNNYGVSGENELRSRVRLTQEAENMTPADVLTAARRVILEHWKEHPEAIDGDPLMQQWELVRSQQRNGTEG